MDASSPDSFVDLTLLASETAGTAVDGEQEVLILFDRCAPQLLRYVASLGLERHETEDIVQEAFLALFRHVTLGRDRRNLTAWLFRVAHNLTLKHRTRRWRVRMRTAAGDDPVLRLQVDPAPTPDVRLAHSERRQRFRSIVEALPERDRRCLFLRAEGLTYRDIATTLGLSLGSVAKSLTRAISRLAKADGGRIR